MVDKKHKESAATLDYSSGESFDICTKVTNYDKLVPVGLSVDAVIQRFQCHRCKIFAKQNIQSVNEVRLT